MKINIRQSDGKFKKWFKYGITCGCCTLILGLGIGGLCYSAFRPYSEIASYSLKPKNDDYNINVSHEVETEVLPLLLQINLKNYYGAIAPTLINNLNFEGENSYGTLIWEVHTKPEDSKALTFFRMSQEYGTIFINLNNSSLYREGDKFDFWVSTVVSLDHVPNAGTFIDSPVTISSDNFHVTVIDDPTD